MKKITIFLAVLAVLVIAVPATAGPWTDWAYGGYGGNSCSFGFMTKEAQIIKASGDTAISLLGLGTDAWKFDRAISAARQMERERSRAEIDRLEAEIERLRSDIRRLEKK